MQQEGIDFTGFHGLRASKSSKRKKANSKAAALLLDDQVWTADMHMT